MSVTEYFVNDAVEKQLSISVEGMTFTNGDFRSEEMELIEQLCSEPELCFGACEASIFKICVLNNVIPLKGKTLDVSMILKGDKTVSYGLGKYKVDSDKPTADRRYRNVIAYDAMYDILNADVTQWYNTVLPKADSAVNLKEFRDSFFDYLGIAQEETHLVNDEMIITRTVEPSKLSGKTVINAICEVNGCFGHIGRDGSFQYVVLKEMIEGVYPSDTLYPKEDLYPAETSGIKDLNKNCYMNAEYEDYIVAKINKLQIRTQEDEVGCIYGNGDNCYVVRDNFLLYGKGDEELSNIAANLYSVISHIWYRPARVEAKGNPCLEVGSGIHLVTKYRIVYSYILQRTLKGIQALRDTYESEGEERRREEVNSVRESIVQLKGKTSKLTRTIEETKLELADLEANTYAQIVANTRQILMKVSKDSIISEINQTAEAITIKADKIDLVGLVEADEFVAKYATINELAGVNMTLSGEINAMSGRIDMLESDYISTKELEAETANIKGMITAVDAKFEALDASKIKAGMVEAEYLDIEGIIKGIGAKTLQCIDFTAQTIRGSVFKIFQENDYIELTCLPITIEGERFCLLGYRNM